ncbi:MAG: 4-coumarate--CoA ligase family protein [Actinomycetia bacterium]|nr:4-coumarate--CoA ligase family protein [Actinomycetes bacterium]MCP4961304.1 4-coumarate--CoA ligase family protein [Actinomycetes bacterium]
MIVHPSTLPDRETPPVSVTDFVLRLADDKPDTPAMIDGASGRVVTFAELKRLVSSLAGGLAARGFGPGSTLALIAPNMPDYAIVFHGVARAGGTVTTVNPVYNAAEIRHQLNDSEATIAVAFADAIPTVLEAIEGTDVREVYSIGASDDCASYETLMGDPIEQVPVDPEEAVVVLPYSSGTTGLPKGVMLTHHNLVANLVQANAALVYDETDVALAVLPFFHIYGMQVLMNGVLAEGCTVITLPRFDLVQALTLIQDHKVTAFYAVPPMVLAFAKQPVIDNFDLSSLKFIFSGAAPLGAELQEECEARVGCPVIQGYGMTELSPITHATLVGDQKAGSIGVAMPGTSVRIVNDDGQDLGIDAEGEMWIRGPQVMKGYLNNPTATADTIDSDGWLHTGDVAKVDSDGHAYIVDRVKELIKYKGFQVPPAELEALIVTHPAVADVAVIGVDDTEAGELPKAFVVLKSDAEATADDIQDFVAERVTSYKKVRIVEFRDEIPKSASGKILRRFLRDEERAKRA